jgi:hypothetical protein
MIILSGLKVTRKNNSHLGSLIILLGQTNYMQIGLGWIMKKLSGIVKS